ncbi:TPA: hypothetical protein ACLBZV_000943 [Bacillus cereus]|uniref:hypothetical protein n=1 Tax=Bacillus TaxID=1386 RepID=UPI0018C3B72C|nr:MULTISPECIES: hypothetical protein [Bacillus]MBG0966263.1 hypothetical protein [Bacillus sp. SRB1LM]BCC10832.1 hypothetical protein BCM0074_1215 [Bacillus cereus]HDR6304638.1 hypothetical protein [Bacillus cereus]
MIVAKIIGIIFIILAYWLVKGMTFTGNNIFSDILQGWTGYFLFYIGFGIIISKTLEKNKVVLFIYKNIFGVPFIAFIYFHYMLAPVLTVMMFLGIYFLPSMLILTLGETYVVIEQYEQGIIYIISLLSLLFFAYKSNKLMEFMIKTFNTKLYKNHLEKYSNIAFTRMYTYMIMIIIYISYNFLTFSHINLDFIPSEMLNVIKEVFVTFVAIDSLMQIILNKQKKQKQ